MSLARNTVPGGFGGWFFDSEGRLNVYLKDARHEAAAASAIRGYLARRRFSLRSGAPDLQQIRFHRGEHDFAALAGWRRVLDDVVFAEVRSLVGTDVSENRNRVVIFVSDPSTVSEVLAIVDRLGVPRSAVDVEVREPWLPAHTLRDVPFTGRVEGGYQIEWRVTGTNQIAQCSFGFNAVRGNTWGFVTAAHCSDREGAWDGEAFYQPLLSSTYRIGTEAFDPSFNTGASICPSYAACRWADALWAEWTKADWGFGRIARTQEPGLESATVVINAGQPYWMIAGETPFAYVNEVLNKVGRTTGWTRGVVTETCVNKPAGGVNQVYLCQDVFSGGTSEGDSGGPVFGLYGNDSHVNLYGIVSAGSRTHTVFSSINNIELDLGLLTTYDCTWEHPSYPYC